MRQSAPAEGVAIVAPLRELFPDPVTLLVFAPGSP